MCRGADLLQDVAQRLQRCIRPVGAQVNAGILPVVPDFQRRRFQPAGQNLAGHPNVARLCAQRPFTECYRLTEDYDKWRTSAATPVEPVRLAVVASGKLLKRNLAMPEYEVVRPVKLHASGVLSLKGLLSREKGLSEPWRESQVQLKLLKL